MMTNTIITKAERFCVPLTINRRTRPRSEIHATIQYQVEDAAAALQECVLHNISETGVFVSCQQDLAVGTSLHIVMPSEDPAEFAIHIIGTVVRKISEPDIDDVCYGCAIERIIDPN